MTNDLSHPYHLHRVIRNILLFVFHFDEIPVSTHYSPRSDEFCGFCPMMNRTLGYIYVLKPFMSMKFRAFGIKLVRVFDLRSFYTFLVISGSENI